MKLTDNRITVSGIRSFLANPAFSEKISIRTSLSSTNDEAKTLALEGAAHGTVIIALSQTAGKGRLGKSFYSPDGGVYMSVILRGQSSTLITPAAAVAVCNALEAICKKTFQIKWVNDVFLDGKKICGILTESPGGVEATVLGIGINIISNESYGGIYGSKPPDYVSNRVIAHILDAVLARDDWFEGVIPEYKRRCFILGKEITVGGEYKATAVDIDDEGGLIVRNPDDTLVTLSSGEISIKL